MKMKEVLYKYSSRGMYVTENSTLFSGGTHMKITAEPHEFSLKVGGDVLRSTSFGGCVAVASCDGGAVFYDMENNEIARVDKGDRCYKEVRLDWKQDFLTLQFGYVAVVDYYPNCDGESDRWGHEWEIQRTVRLNLKDNSVEAD